MNNPTHSDVPSEPLKNSTKSGTSNSAKQSPAAAGTPTFPTSVESQESAPTHPTADTASHTAAKKSAKKSAEPPTKPTYPAMEAKQPSGVQGSFAGGTWIALIAGALLLIMLLVFIMQNQDQVDLVLFAWNFRFRPGSVSCWPPSAGRSLWHWWVVYGCSSCAVKSLKPTSILSKPSIASVPPAGSQVRKPPDRLRRTTALRGHRVGRKWFILRPIGHPCWYEPRGHR